MEETIETMISQKLAAKEVVKAYNSYDNLVLLCLFGGLIGVITSFFLKNAYIIVFVATAIFCLWRRQSFQNEKKRLNEKYSLEKSGLFG